MAGQDRPNAPAGEKDDGAWFAPKSFGYGAGLPVAWQGWVLLAGYVALALGCAMLVEHGAVIIGSALLVAATLALVWIAKAKTRGGWRWRRGADGD